ncbi:MAG TPA: glutamate mutase L, partial [Bacillota bacterium]
MRAYLLIDFGSTYTKVTLVDAEEPALLAQAQAPTTADRDILRGLTAAVDALRRRFGPLPPIEARLAASSAAGGLRLAAVGLVPDLTAEAARMAALGAGARVIATHAYRLTRAAVDRLRVEDPDMILLAGGTDGGNLEVVLHNARMLAAAKLDAPVVYAGNAAAREQVVRLLAAAGIPVQAAANVMPRLGRLEVDEAREVIRRLFMEHIVRAKGMDRARQHLDGVLMPTPAAVLRAARLLAEGPGESDGLGRPSAGAAGPPGLGALLVVDVGGATTDVHSISPGGVIEPGVEGRGLAEPYEKRTVEGDLGMRISAPGILEAVGAEELARWVGRARGVLAGSAAFAADPEAGAGDAGDAADAATGAAAGDGDLKGYIRALAGAPDRVPEDRWQAAVDHALARCAVGLAVRRHAGRLRVLEGPFGRRRVQRGKDLRPVRTVIGTGGV